MQLTLAIIKPDAMEKRLQGAILQRILAEGFEVVALRQTRLTREQAEGFYAVHREKPFFDGLCSFMSRGPVVVMALSREDAVRHWREVIGATNPADAAEGTIRKHHASSVTENAVHGSDSQENGRLECGYFFPGVELL
ncbi:MAG: nucleoside-diphosphate kinase [Polyangiaceae bacterium]|nr:nucleoside-diphosphate kinase [Polyangiaceae bacterium]